LALKIWLKGFIGVVLLLTEFFFYFGVKIEWSKPKHYSGWFNFKTQAINIFTTCQSELESKAEIYVKGKRYQ